MEKILSAKINRKKFLVGFFLLAILTSCLNVVSTELVRLNMTQYEDLLSIVYLLFLLFYLLLFNARCNDINGMTTGKKIGIILLSCIPLIGLVSVIYLAYKRGADCEQILRNRQSVQSQIDDKPSKRTESLKDIKNTLLTDLKKFWVLTFCVVSLATCILYVPYNLVHSNNPDMVYKTAHATIFAIPEKFKPQLTKIDYQAIAFRELLILIGCCAGYTVSTMIKKK